MTVESKQYASRQLTCMRLQLWHPGWLAGVTGWLLATVQPRLVRPKAGPVIDSIFWRHDPKLLLKMSLETSHRVWQKKNEGKLSLSISVSCRNAPSSQ